MPTPLEILLVEDNEGDARLIKEIVSGCSVAIRITVATDCREAVAIIAGPQFRPDLIITDMSVSKIAGPELLERCNAKSIPVVVFSSTRNPTAIADVLNSGAKEFVEKPIELTEYTEAVWKMIWKWVQPPT